jgi:hypothetical protein
MAFCLESVSIAWVPSNIILFSSSINLAVCFNLSSSAFFASFPLVGAL